MSKSGGKVTSVKNKKNCVYFLVGFFFIKVLLLFIVVYSSVTIVTIEVTDILSGSCRHYIGGPN